MDASATLALAAVNAPARLAPLLADYLRSLDALASDPSDAEAREHVELACLAAWEDPELACLLDQVEGYYAERN